MKSNYTYEDLLAGNLELESDDTYFGEGHLSEAGIEKARELGLILLADTLVDPNEVRRQLDDIDAVDADRAMDEAFDVFNRLRAAKVAELRQRLGLPEPAQEVF